MGFSCIGVDGLVLLGGGGNLVSGIEKAEREMALDEREKNGYNDYLNIK